MLLLPQSLNGGFVDYSTVTCRLRFAARGNGGIDTTRNVLDGLQDVELQIVTPLFFGGCQGVKSVSDVIVLGITEFLQRIGAHMLIGDD